MILNAVQSIVRTVSILHVCGDDPLSVKFFLIIPSVFSTYVEMILCVPDVIGCIRSILHVCGDDPASNASIEDMQQGILHVCGDDPVI